MARTKGSKNKSKQPPVECLPPEDRGEISPATDSKEEVISCLLKVITRPNGYPDAYCVGKQGNGKPYILRLNVGFDRPPLTKDLKKRLGIGED